MLQIGNIHVHLAFIFQATAAVCGGFGSAGALAAVAPEPLVARDDWGAFIDQRLGRCWAVARPEPDGRVRGEAAARVLVLRGTGLPQLQLTPARPAAAASLVIDGRTVPLAGNDLRWWPSRDEAAVLASLRSARSMQLIARSADGRTIRHRFRLAGAATAIDAAILACAPARPVANRPQ